MSSQHDFTHVHLLAHGVSFQQGGEDQYGIALCHPGDPTRDQPVSGDALAKCLGVRTDDGLGRSRPSVVSLATCDSGAQNSVLVPGGSVAHDLHFAGVPWVFASQFPLTMVGSVGLVDTLYTRLLRGDDPRIVIHEVRQRLFAENRSNHDWGSLVCYASVPADFDTQMAALRDRQIRSSVTASFDRARQLLDRLYPEDKTIDKSIGKSEVDQATRTTIENRVDREIEWITTDLERWQRWVPQGDQPTQRYERAHFCCERGAKEKQLAEIYVLRKDRDRAKKLLQRSRASYRSAMKLGVGSHWGAVQYLAVSAFLHSLVPEVTVDRGSWESAKSLAEADLDRPDTEHRIYALCSLAELSILSFALPKEHWDQGPFVGDESVQRKLKERCENIVTLAGQESWTIFCTRRQFGRYSRLIKRTGETATLLDTADLALKWLGGR